MHSIGSAPLNDQMPLTKAILFDLGNVLVAFEFARGYRAIELCSRFRADQIPSLIAGSGLVPSLERGEISGLDFFAGLRDILGLTCTFEQFCDLWSAIFLPEPILPETLLAGLRRRCRLVLISNTNDIHFRMIERTYPLIRQFDDLVLSFRVGAMKPAERIYAEAVRQAGCEPYECFYTDDVKEFVEAGRTYGLDAVEFTGPSALEQELQRRGLFAD